VGLIERSRVEYIVHISPERSIPPKSGVHQVPMEGTLMVVPDDFLLPAFALALELGVDLVELDELLELLATVSCPEISENKNKDRVCDKPIFMTPHGHD